MQHSIPSSLRLFFPTCIKQVMWYLTEITLCLRGFPAAGCSVETFFGELLVGCSSCDALRRDTRRKKVEWAVGGQPFSLSLLTLGGLKLRKRLRELSIYTPRVTSLWRREDSASLPPHMINGRRNMCREGLWRRRGTSILHTAFFYNALQLFRGTTVRVIS